MNKQRKEIMKAMYPWLKSNDPKDEQLDEMFVTKNFPWLDNVYVADVTRKPNVDAWEKLNETNR